MKKSLPTILARMAKDGDIETVAEIIEEMIEPDVVCLLSFYLRVPSGQLRDDFDWEITGK